MSDIDFYEPEIKRTKEEVDSFLKGVANDQKNKLHGLAGLVAAGPTLEDHLDRHEAEKAGVAAPNADWLKNKLGKKNGFSM